MPGKATESISLKRNAEVSKEANEEEHDNSEAELDEDSEDQLLLAEKEENGKIMAGEARLSLAVKIHTVIRTSILPQLQRSMVKKVNIIMFAV